MEVGSWKKASLPPGSVPTAYTGFKYRYGEAPADYSEVVVFGRPEEFIARFNCKREGLSPNLIILRPDTHIARFRVAPTCQIYVDLWNLNTWYANEFLKKLEAIINGVLAQLGYSLAIR